MLLFCSTAAGAQEWTGPTGNAPVLTGIDVLQQSSFAALRGKSVGLVTNQAGLNRAGQSTIDLLYSAPGVRLTALFAPEHGIRGNIVAGARFGHNRDAVTGLPVYSLYGRTHGPTSSMLRGVQVLVFDLQEVGARSYTYLATLERCRKACAARGITFMVLDRPNPVGGAMEGNLPNRFSIVCPFPIPYRHGLTVGELAQWLNARASRKARLSVVRLQNYRRQIFDETGLTWTRTSPNIPRSTSPFFYHATGILGELPAVSVGIGTGNPFEVVGAPGINAYALSAELNRRRIPGWTFQAAYWTPGGGRFLGRQCAGVRLFLTAPNRAQATRVNFEIFDALRKVAPRTAFFSSSTRNAMFDAVCGTPRIRQMLQRGQSLASVWQIWNQGATAFRRQSATYRLYG